MPRKHRYAAKNTSIAVTEQTWARLKAHADKTGKSMSQLVAEMVDRAVGGAK